MPGRRALHLIVLVLVVVALAAAIGGRAWSANAKPVHARVRVVEVVKPRGFDLRSAGIGAGTAIAAVGSLAAAYVLFGLATRSRT